MTGWHERDGEYALVEYVICKNCGHQALIDTTIQEAGDKAREQGEMAVTHRMCCTQCHQRKARIEVRRGLYYSREELEEIAKYERGVHESKMYPVNPDAYEEMLPLGYKLPGQDG